MSATGRCFDIGNCTRKAIALWENGEQKKIETGFGSEKGNGSLMRCAPIALAYYKDYDKAVEYAKLQSTVTHPAAACQEACAVWVGALSKVLSGELKTKDEVRNFFVKEWKYEQGDLKEVITKAPRLIRREVNSSGYVLHTIQAALWCFLTTESFADCALLAANLGNDSDTVAAISGGLAGTFYVMNGQLERDERFQKWRGKVMMQKEIEELAKGLETAEGRGWQK